MSETSVPSNLPSSATLSDPSEPSAQSVSNASNTTESPGTANRPTVGNDPKSLESSSGSSGGIDQNIAERCLGFIKEFELGSRGKMWSWFGIQNAIVGALAGDENRERRNTALDFYYKLLEDADAKLKAVPKPEREGKKIDNQKKRAHSSSAEDGSSGEGSQNDEDEAGTEDENSLVREKVDKRHLAWLLPEGAVPFPSKSVIDRNRLTFANWRRDPSLVERLAMRSKQNKRKRFMTINLKLYSPLNLKNTVVRENPELSKKLDSYKPHEIAPEDGYHR
ncbi:hypothetical protein K435DRAFT_796402 [Dendrothele bispora CBS 962.96]|uniref:Uncharacterized protein n=1 Tax=Dendrothele bispora (strain CBS 962.96) TaxID=1314807 RepID=A0A4S8M727_DENBC|nr:hypothetical protein K435DRAFT_796402 [Dendrothele bispora CBS 962.96]